MDWILMQCLLWREGKALLCMNKQHSSGKSLVQRVKKFPVSYRYCNTQTLLSVCSLLGFLIGADQTL